MAVYKENDLIIIAIARTGFSRRWSSLFHKLPEKALFFVNLRSQFARPPDCCFSVVLELHFKPIDSSIDALVSRLINVHNSYNIFCP